MLHYKQKLSLAYWIYAIAVRISISRFGTFMFKITKSFAEGHRDSRIGKLWWHFYLLNFAKNYDKDSLIKSNSKTVAVHWLQEYHFRFYNALFHNSTMAHVLYEAERGNIPRICDEFGVWNDFFEQPFGDDGGVPETESTVKGNLCVPRFGPYNKTVTRLWQKVYRDFTIPNKTLQSYVDSECAQIFKDTDKVLGVLCRGTDYIILRPKNHPRQPSVDEVVSTCRKWMKKYGYEAIYLATEEKAICERFEKEFPGKILTNNRSYYDDKMKEEGLSQITEVHFDRENDDYYKGLEYLSSLYILSRCKAFVAGNCGGTGIAFLLNDDKFERMKVFDKGLY